MPTTTERSELPLLDDLLNDLASETETRSDLLREHLESARQYLVGAMPAEYRFNLKLAYENLHTVSDDNLRFKLERFIERQVNAPQEMPPRDVSA